MATIKVFIDAFPTIIIPNVDIATFSFYGCTDGYDWPESKDKNFSTIGFVADNAQFIVDEIKKEFKLNPKYSKPEDYIWVRNKFEDYETDKRPRIGIKLPNGSRGMINPPQFSIIAD